MVAARASPRDACGIIGCGQEILRKPFFLESSKQRFWILSLGQGALIPFFSSSPSPKEVCDKIFRNKWSETQFSYLQAEGFGFRALCIWLVFWKCRSLTLSLSCETWGKNGVSWTRGSETALLSCTSDTYSFRIFIYLFLGGNELEAPQQKELSFLSANTMPNCQLLCVCQHYSQATWLQSELGSSTHWKPQFNFSVCQGPDLSSPFLPLACLLPLIRFFCSGIVLTPHPFHVPANEAQWLSLAPLWIEGINSRWDLPKTKHRQRSSPFLFICMIPSPSQPVGAPPCHWVRAEKGTDRSREFIFWLLLPRRPHNLLKHEPMWRIPRSSLPGTVSL